MAVYRDGIHCFGCGKSIPRTMEALAYLLYGDERRWKDALRVAEKYIGREETYRQKREGKIRPFSRTLAEAFVENLWGPARRSRVEWLMGRCLSEDTIRQAMIGHTGMRFTLPVFDKDQRLVTIRFRRDDASCKPEWEQVRPTPKYAGLAGRNGSYLYPEWLIAEHRPSELSVWEGEFDTLLCWQLGFPAVTITNGASSLKKLPALVRERFSFVQRLVIGGDRDAAGEQARKEVMHAARTAGYATRLLCWEPVWGKDLTELITNGYSLARMQLMTGEMYATDQRDHQKRNRCI